MDELEELENLNKSERLSRKDCFQLSSWEEKLDKSDELLQECAANVKNQVLEKIKLTKLRRSSTSLKRRKSDADTGHGDDTRPQSRPRVNSPPPLPENDDKSQ